MPHVAAIRARLASMAGLPDAAWVVAAKELFASWRPTVAEVIRFLGTRTKELTGGVAVRPTDQRFDRAYVCGRSAGADTVVPTHLLAFGGPSFSVRPADLVGTLPLFEADYNTYDGGRFFFFHPFPPNSGGLSGIQLYATDEDDRGGSGLDSVCHQVDFEFGPILTRYRNGFSCEDPEIALERFAHRWFSALAEHRDAEAVKALKEPTSYGIRWTTAAIRARIAQYGAREVTSPETARGKPRSSIIALADGTGWSFEHNVPLDGEWSDLTAQFDFLRRDGDFAVVLHDLHVL